ncbi:MAG: hypothetical protein F9K27_06820 [Anaerolineae bacterium]|nr:MAG: hypothetical protein F9K27_06820 [Anaerolineae bacterium]
MAWMSHLFRVALAISWILLLCSIENLAVAQEQTIDRPIKIFTVQPVRLIEWNPKSDVIATLSKNEITIDLIDVKSGQVIRKLGDNLKDLSQITAIAWSPDGEKLASFESGAIARVWDVDTGQVLSSIHIADVSGAEGVASLASIQWHPQKNLVAIGDTLNLNIWDIEVNQVEIISLDIMETGVAWNPQGNLIAVIDEGSNVVILETETFKVVSVLKISDLIQDAGPTMSVNKSQYLEWTPNGEKVSHYYSNGDDEIVIFVWDVFTQEVTTIPESAKDDIQALAWRPIGNWLAFSSGSTFDKNNDDNLIRIWNIESNELVFILEGHTDLVSSISWSPDGTRLASGSWDGTIRIWDIPRGSDG